MTTNDDDHLDGRGERFAFDNSVEVVVALRCASCDRVLEARHATIGEELDAARLGGDEVVDRVVRGLKRTIADRARGRRWTSISCARCADPLGPGDDGYVDPLKF